MTISQKYLNLYDKIRSALSCSSFRVFNSSKITLPTRLAVEEKDDRRASVWPVRSVAASQVREIDRSIFFLGVVLGGRGSKHSAVMESEGWKQKSQLDVGSSAFVLFGSKSGEVLIFELPPSH